MLAIALSVSLEADIGVYQNRDPWDPNKLRFSLWFPLEENAIRPSFRKDRPICTSHDHSPSKHAYLASPTGPPASEPRLLTGYNSSDGGRVEAEAACET